MGELESSLFCIVNIMMMILESWCSTEPHETMKYSGVEMCKTQNGYLVLMCFVSLVAKKHVKVGKISY